MSKEDEELYVQCMLVKGKTVQTAWMPKRKISGGHVALKREDGTFDDGWRVCKIYRATERPWKQVRERGEDHKNTRKASDV